MLSLIICRWWWCYIYSFSGVMYKLDVIDFGHSKPTYRYSIKGSIRKMAKWDLPMQWLPNKIKYLSYLTQPKCIVAGRWMYARCIMHIIDNSKIQNISVGKYANNTASSIEKSTQLIVRMEQDTLTITIIMGKWNKRMVSYVVAIIMVSWESGVDLFYVSAYLS